MCVYVYVHIYIYMYMAVQGVSAKAINLIAYVDHHFCSSLSPSLSRFLAVHLLLICSIGVHVCSKN